MLVTPSVLNRARGKTLRRPSGGTSLMSGGAAGAFNPQSLLDDWKKQYSTARQSNETRYADILKGYEERYNTGLGNLNGAGAQAASDINQDYFGKGAGIQQSLVASGLSGTTIAPTMQLGVERERQDAQGRLQEQLRKERLATQAGLSKDTLDFKERRTDEYPDTGIYASLLEKWGAMGGGAGGPVAPAAPAAYPAAPKPRVPMVPIYDDTNPNMRTRPPRMVPRGSYV